MATYLPSSILNNVLPVYPSPISSGNPDNGARYGYGTTSILDYVKAVEEGQIKIKDKEYRKIIQKLIENNKPKRKKPKVGRLTEENVQ